MECRFVILMPDHLHLVFQLTGEKTLSQVIKSLKGFTGRKIKRHLSLNRPVWQEQFYDHAIREDEDLIEIVKYCMLNPVQEGLVENPLDYPHWRSKLELCYWLVQGSFQIGIRRSLLRRILLGQHRNKSYYR